MSAIAVPSVASEDLRAAGEDAARILGRISGTLVAIEKGGSGGIRLAIRNTEGVPESLRARLKGLPGEAYVIQSGVEATWIVGGDERGAIHGIYGYLARLGYRQFLPGSMWEEFPVLDDVVLQVDETVVPRFRVREFSGTGGFGKLIPGGASSEVARKWEEWKRRNRFGGEFRIGGHAGDDFNRTHEALLKREPDLLAEVGGKRVKWSPGAKLDISNPKAVELFVSDRVQVFKKLRKRNPRAFGVSVEPADGGGYCDSESCRQVGSISDGLFMVANRVARIVANENPPGYATMLAYREHAAVPSIPLEPNVYVMVVPYAFQRTLLSDNELLAAWTKKARRVSVYDYWAIPDWNFDQPILAVADVASKIEKWDELGVEGIKAESSYAAGAVGLPLFVASRLEWNPDANARELRSRFISDAFGPAVKPMSRMLSRWEREFVLTSQELHLSYRDIEQAIDLTEVSGRHRQRVLSYAGYVAYLDRLLAWRSAAGEERNKVRAAEALLRTVSKLAPLLMVHSYRIHNLVLRRHKELRSKYGRKLPELGAYTWDELTRIASDGAARFSAPLFDESSDHPPSVAQGDRQWRLEAASNVNLTVSGPFEFDVEATGERPADFSVRGNSPIRLVLGSKGHTLDVPAKTRRQVTMTGARVQHVSLRTADKTAQTKLEFPPAVSVRFSRVRTPKSRPSPPLYFRVPKGLRTIALYHPIRLPQKLLPELRSGDQAPSRGVVKDGGRLQLVATGRAGDAVWSMRGLIAPDRSVRLLNAPQRFALRPEDI